MTGSDVPERVERVIAPSLEAMGYEIVRVRLTGGGHPTLQIMAERADRRGVTVDDCAKISRAVSPLLDVEDVIAGPFNLEVSSPGLDRPLVRPRDFERFAGSEAKVETSRPIGGRKRFRGRLLGLTAAGVRMDLDGSETVLPFEAISRARLVTADDRPATSAQRR